MLSEQLIELYDQATPAGKAAFREELVAFLRRLGTPAALRLAERAAAAQK